MKRLNVLVLGSGGREHALVWKLHQSPGLAALHAAPGNPGMAALATCHACDPCIAAEVLALARSLKIDLVVVGPEAPLVAGVVDALQAEGILAFGPSQAAAALEASKGFTKRLCQEAGIPTARFSEHSALESALAQLDHERYPLVIKADGLAAGKGVIIAANRAEAEAALRDILGGRFGAAGSRVVMEEFLEGEEASLFLLCDGKEAHFFGTAQDHKRLLDGDEGPNTGGMGAYSPAPVMTDAKIEEAMARIVRPTLEAMAARGTPFVGFLYAGLMLTEAGVQLIEYNVRFGDPECQVIMPLCQSDLLDLLAAAARGDLEGREIEFSNQSALSVVLAAKGYPDAPRKGGEIALPEIHEDASSVIYHAGTRLESGVLKASGGRVLAVTAWDDDLQNAREHAYALLGKVGFADGAYRQDIGWRALRAN